VLIIFPTMTIKKELMTRKIRKATQIYTKRIQTKKIYNNSLYSIKRIINKIGENIEELKLSAMFNKAYKSVNKILKIYNYEKI